MNRIQSIQARVTRSFIAEVGNDRPTIPAPAFAACRAAALRAEIAHETLVEELQARPTVPAPAPVTASEIELDWSVES